MALFTDTRELDRQEKTFNKNPSTGNKAVLTSMLGYKSDGTLNTWGKINPFIGGGGTNKLAAEINKGNDAGKALEASQAEANQHTKDKLKLGLDVLTLGGSKLATSITQGISGIEGGDATDIAGKIKDFATGSKAKDDLNSQTEVGPGGVDSFGDAVLTDNPEEDGLSSAGIEKFREFMKENPDGTREMFEETMKEAGGMEDLLSGAGAEKAIGMSDALPVIGTAIGAVGSGVDYDAKLKLEAGKIGGRKQMDTFNYL
jgi:hypothetical protein